VLEKPWPSLFVGISSSIGATTGPSTTLLGLPREMVLLIAEHLDVPLQEHNKFCS
jgi:Na+/H+ antiporter NhaC